MFGEKATTNNSAIRIIVVIPCNDEVTAPLSDAFPP